jgi:hypothetical protein
VRLVLDVIFVAPLGSLLRAVAALIVYIEPSALKRIRFFHSLILPLFSQYLTAGRAFTLLEESKALLHIEDYSIAQPTLEQVLI